MKKFYFSLFAALIGVQVANAQLTLTKVANDPVAGDAYTTNGLDTSNALPNTVTGSGVTWSVTGVSTNTTVNAYTYSAAASVPAAANYTGCTIVQASTNGTETYLKQTTNTLEIVGLYTAQFDIKFSDAALIATYPVAYSNTTTDNVAGTIDAAGNTGTFTGNIVTTADGSGTFNLNNGAVTLNNCLRVKSAMTLNANITVSGFPVSVTVRQTIYNYFHGSSKFPIFTQSYMDIASAVLNQSTATVELNNNQILSINDKSASNISFTAYPNPANDVVNLHFVLASTDSYSIEVVNTLGQTVKLVNLSNLQPGMYNETISLNGLNKGFYFVKVKGAASEGVQKILVQ